MPNIIQYLAFILLNFVNSFQYLQVLLSEVNYFKLQLSTQFKKPFIVGRPCFNVSSSFICH